MIRYRSALVLAFLGLLTLATPARSVLSDLVAPAENPPELVSSAEGQESVPTSESAQSDPAPGADSGPTVSSSEPLAVAGEEGPPTDTPSLSEADKAKAELLVASDANFRRLLGVTQYQLEKIGSWTTSDQRMIGAALELSLSEAKTISGDWPTIRHTDTPGAFYRKTIEKYTAAKVRVLYVLVDLGTPPGVVSITPDGDAPVTLAAGQQPSYSPREGGK